MLKLFKKSIALQLWLVMILLVLTILWLTGFVQTKVLEQTYYKQHLDQLTTEGKKVVHNIENNNSGGVNALSHILGLNIMIVTEDGYLKECRGMGMDMAPGTETDIFGHHGIPWGEKELQEVIQGETLYYVGKNNFLDQDVISVALPYQKLEERGMVMVSAPLSPVADRVAVLQRVTLYSGIGGIIIATLLSFLLSRSVSYPLVRMNRVARAISRGDYSQKLAIKREDEVGVLANTLDTLSRELEEKIATIERLDNTRRDFIANVSHELRTPLSVMQACTEALADGIAETEEERKEYLENIHQELLRLRRLASEVLDLRKLESGNIDFNFYPVDIFKVLQEVTHTFSAIAQKKNISLEQELDDSLPGLIRTNEDKIKQVFINILDNAVKVTPEGGKVSIKANMENGRIKFVICDSGPGINPKEQPLIWERFYKTDKSRNREGSGTGLGLPLVKRIIEAHGGEIWVESTPGQGTAFIFIVPIA